MTLVLYILSGKELGRVERFDQREVLVGRADSADLRLQHPGVSRQHAKLVRQSEQSVLLQDLDSTSGTFYEGEAVPRVMLTDGAIFRLADVELRLRIETQSMSAAETTSAPDADETVTPGEFGGGLELEGDWEERAPSPEAVSPAPSLASGPKRATPAPSEARLSPLEEARRAHRKTQRPAGGKPVLQYARTEGEGGWARGDLAQRPAWQRGLVALLALILLAALAYGSFQLTQGLRDARQSPASEDLE